MKVFITIFACMACSALGFYLGRYTAYDANVQIPLSQTIKPYFIIVGTRKFDKPEHWILTKNDKAMTVWFSTEQQVSEFIDKFYAFVKEAP